ncbi:MAG: threonine aldolase [Granulosicoccus sp.]|jgi:threonine aldolase
MTNRYSFLDDYSEGCHPDILSALSRTNLTQQTAYGDDEYSINARQLIRNELNTADTPIFFVAGGTLANIIIMSGALRSHEAVIAAHTGHIVVRETGAIEATGHKIITVATDDGKLTPDLIETTLRSNAHFPHMTRPKLVYISNATEVGTVYTKQEVTALSDCCKSNNLFFMMDGARLGTAITALKSDLSLSDVVKLCDIFWIGGTKAGALIGEAIIIPNAKLADDFAFHIKQRGALLAKGRLLGIQFETLFTNQLFFKLSGNANKVAQRLSNAFTDAGHELAAATESNQIFPILPNKLISQLKEKFDFYVWEPLENDRSVVRLVTSWATDESQVDVLTEALLQ